MYRADTRGRERVTRIVCEVVTFQALREQLRCKEIWVVGADSWRNPDEDLPADFEQRRGQNYGELRKPLDPAVFIHDLRSEMTAALDELDTAVPSLEWLDITDRASGAITLSKYEAAPEPRNLRRIKAEVQRRWGTVALIDILKETVLCTGCLADVSAVAGSGTLPVEVLAERLMLAIYAYGTTSESAPWPPAAAMSTLKTKFATSESVTSPVTPAQADIDQRDSAQSPPHLGLDAT